MNLIIFLFLCSVSVITGVGLLYLLGFKNPEDPIFIASPVISLCLWSLTLGIGVSLYIPVHILSYPIWIINLVLCLIAFRFFKLRKFISTFLGLAGIALLISLPYLIHDFSHYSGSPFADGWSYIAFGQYIWKYPRCLEGGLAPLYQYAAHLCRTRFISSSLLGLFSPLTGTPGDIQAAAGFFIPWVFFVYAGACKFFIQAHTSKTLSWIYTFLCVVSGWAFTIQSNNNFDQALAISFLPVIAGILDRINFSEKHWGCILAVLLSSCIYIYPEMTPFIFLSAFILLVYLIINRRIGFKKLVTLGVVFIPLFVLFSAAFASNWFNFLLSQFSTISASVRPGESIASELLDNKYRFWGIWGLGGYLDAGNFSKILNAIRYINAFIFSFLAFWGLVELIKNKNKWGLVGVLAFLGSSITYFIFVQKYSYGAYKIISISWWLVIYLIILAVQRAKNIKEQVKSLPFAKNPLTFSQKSFWLRSISFHKISITIQVAFLLASFVTVTVNVERSIQYDRTIKFQNINIYKNIDQIEALTNYAPIGISIHDPLANLWAMYYLRDSVTSFFTYQSYPNQSHVLPLMARSQKVDTSQIQYLLVDSDTSFQPPVGEVVWYNEVYRLWKIDQKATGFISEINNPNGLEGVQNNLFLWIGDKPAQIFYISRQDDIVELTAEFSAGPSLPEFSQRLLSLQVNDYSIQKKILPGAQKIQFPVKKGLNKIGIQGLDKPTISKLPNGDVRILLIGIENLSINLKGTSN